MMEDSVLFNTGPPRRMAFLLFAGFALLPRFVDGVADRDVSLLLPLVPARRSAEDWPSGSSVTRKEQERREKGGKKGGNWREKGGKLAGQARQWRA
jgi:hypothetical protein